MKTGVKIVLAVNLAALALLAFAYPHLMLAPGKLIPGHQGLEADCFACHAPFRGAASERCTTCHKPAEIGRTNTRGQPVATPLKSGPFHQGLASQDCVACHSDHAGVKRYRWQGGFRHDLLSPAMREQCETCHKAPADTLHRQVAGGCLQCHTQTKWKPATFDHGRQFVLDRDHNAACATCHSRGDYKRYTCYGCHEHTADGMRRKQVHEGIRDFENCVSCHRSGDKHGIKGGENRGREGGRRGREHDD